MSKSVNSCDPIDIILQPKPVSTTLCIFKSGLGLRNVTHTYKQSFVYQFI